MNASQGGKATRGCLFAATLLLTGCYTTTFRSGLPPEPQPKIANDERWHHGVVWGVGELSGPYDINELCPGGKWAEITTHTSFVNGLIEFIASGLYAPQTITVRCAKGTRRRPSPFDAEDPGAHEDAGTDGTASEPDGFDTPQPSTPTPSDLEAPESPTTAPPARPAPPPVSPPAPPKPLAPPAPPRPPPPPPPPAPPGAPR